MLRWLPVLALVFVLGCTRTTATVTDNFAALADSEAAALSGAGRERLVKGCEVQVLRTTDRAARVKAVKCPASPSMMPLDRWPAGTTEGWVAKSALDL